MDGELLKKLAKFKLLAKRTEGKTIEISKLMSDKDYAMLILTEAEESDSEDMILLALEVKSALGLLAPIPVTSAASAAKPEVTPEPPKDDGKSKNKYLFGARG